MDNMAWMRLNTQAIKEARDKLGLTQEQAARGAGIGGKQNWNRIETGQRKDIEAGTLFKIARLLKRKMEDLIIDDAKGKR